MKKYQKGFTVLELLVVVGIICIMVALVLVGLTAARSNAKDQEKISTVQTVVVGLAQFHDICRMYPAILDTVTQYPCLNNQTLLSLMPNLATTTSNSDYQYAGIADSSDPRTCIGFHMGAKLANQSNSSGTLKAGFGPAEYGTTTVLCQTSGPDFEAGATETLPWFDIKK